jgi:hypothetical protein
LDRKRAGQRSIVCREVPVTFTAQLLSPVNGRSFGFEAVANNKESLS